MTDELAERIGETIDKSGRMVKFNALRLMFEVLLGERLPVLTQKKLYNKAQRWTPDREY